MDYALILLLPILGGLLLGQWLSAQYGASPIWSLVLAILGMFGGLAIMYKRYAHPELYGQPRLPVMRFKPRSEPTAGSPAPAEEPPDKPVYYDLSDLRDLIDKAEPDEDDDLDLREFDRDDPRP